MVAARMVTVSPRPVRDRRRGGRSVGGSPRSGTPIFCPERMLGRARWALSARHGVSLGTLAATVRLVSDGAVGGWRSEIRGAFLVGAESTTVGPSGADRTRVGDSDAAASPEATLRSGSVTASPRAPATAARPRSPADGYRLSGSFASARRMTRSKYGPERRTASEIAGGAASRWAYIRASWVSRGKGTRPVSNSKRTHRARTRRPGHQGARPSTPREPYSQVYQRSCLCLSNRA